MRICYRTTNSCTDQPSIIIASCCRLPKLWHRPWLTTPKSLGAIFEIKIIGWELPPPPRSLSDEDWPSRSLTTAISSHWQPSILVVAPFSSPEAHTAPCFHLAATPSLIDSPLDPQSLMGTLWPWPVLYRSCPFASPHHPSSNDPLTLPPSFGVSTPKLLTLLAVFCHLLIPVDSEQPIKDKESRRRF